MSFSHDSPYWTKTGASPESPFLARRSLNTLSCGFPPSDICTTQSLPAHRVAAQVASGTGTSAHVHTPGSVYRPGSYRLLPPGLSNSVLFRSSFPSGIFGGQFHFFFSMSRWTAGTSGATSPTRGRLGTRFCVCESPRGELSHIASLTLGCSRSDFFRSIWTIRPHMWGYDRHNKSFKRIV